jgi:CBS domain-containing protein
MDTPDRINYAAQRLKEGHRINRLTVRDFLRLFGAERRGAVKVQAIRNILDSLDLETYPDFETAWIDGPLRLGLKEGVDSVEPSLEATECITGPKATSESGEDLILGGTLSAVEQAEEQAASAPISTEAESPIQNNSEGPSTEDPTFRIGRMPAANKKVVAVNQNDPLTRAVTLLLQHDFSQLPVMQGEREVKGVITWKSIGSRFALGGKCETVADCREDARVVDSGRTLFDTIPTIVEYGYVLVRDQRDRKITGIVTASDLSLEFRTLSEPFLLLREVELHIRKILAGGIDIQDLAIVNPAPSLHRTPQNIADLSFGDYIRLVQHPAIWPKLNLKIDSKVLVELLNSVRLIRNDVMHFDPDPMTEDDLRSLKQAVHFMQELYLLLPNRSN